MPATPAATPLPPSTAIPASWNPAVPPPPVTGAAVGIGLYEGLEVGLAEGLEVGLAEGLTLGDTDGLTEGLVLALTEAVADVLPPMATPVTVADTVTPLLTVGVRTVTDEEPADVQAESATQATTVVRPQPTTVRRFRCSLIKPPHRPGKDISRSTAAETGAEGKRAADPFCLLIGSAGELPRQKADGHNRVSPACGTNRQWRAQHGEY
jgi:hypothetical protein